MTSQTGMGTYLYPSTGSAPRHAPSSIGGNAHVYDLNGNLTSGSGSVLTFDVENRPLTANGLSMVYDGDGFRVKLGNTVYISNLYEIDTSTGTATDYIFFGDSQIARKRSGAVHYYHGDKLSSVTAISDSTGIIVLRKTYAPYGNIVLQPGTLTDSFGLAGQRLDPTGLYHMGAREMAPNMGLFVTPDPSNAANPEKPQTLNRYAYALNTPTNLFDPTGYAAEDLETSYDQFSFWAHNTLSGLGTIPALGAIPDTFDLVYTGIEIPFGKSTWTDFGLASAGLGATAAPVIGDGVAAGAKITARAVRRAEQSIGAVDNAAGAALRSNKEAGDRASNLLNKWYGGDSQFYQSTSLGKRYIDNFVGGVAQESKVGRTSASKANMLQMQKDILLRERPSSPVKSIEWHFSPGKTGSGPTVPFKKKLESNGIKVVEHGPKS